MPSNQNIKLCLATLVATLWSTQARADLVAGDVAIVGIHADNPDRFAWVPLVDLSPGQQIMFTDRSWFSGALLTTDFNDGLVTFTTPSEGISAGTVQLFNKSSSTAPDYVFTSSFNLFSGEGDQVFAYVGTVESPTFLFAAQTNSTQFQTSPGASSVSDMPAGLELGLTAVALGAGPGPQDDYDNVMYAGSLTEGTQTEILEAIANPDNWVRSGTPISNFDQELAGLTFTVHNVAAVPEASPLLVTGLVALLGLATSGTVAGVRRLRSAA